MQAPRFTPEYKSVLCALHAGTVPNHFNHPPLAHPSPLSYWPTAAMHASVFTPRAQHHPPYSCSGTQCPVVDVGIILQVLYRQSVGIIGGPCFLHIFSNKRALRTLFPANLYCAVLNQLHGRRISNMAFFWNVGISPSHPLVACTPSRTGASLTLLRFGPSRSQFYINNTMTLSTYIQVSHF